MTKPSTRQRTCQWTKHALGTQQLVEVRREFLRCGGICTASEGASSPMPVPVVRPEDLAACRHKSPALDQGSWWSRLRGDLALQHAIDGADEPVQQWQPVDARQRDRRRGAGFVLPGSTAGGRDHQVARREWIDRGAGEELCERHHRCGLLFMVIGFLLRATDLAYDLVQVLVLVPHHLRSAQISWLPWVAEAARFLRRVRILTSFCAPAVNPFAYFLLAFDQVTSIFELHHCYSVISLLSFFI